MKTITSRWIGVIISIHLAFAWSIGGDIEPFESMTIFPVIIILVAGIVTLACCKLDLVYKDYRFNRREKFKQTAKTPWFWVLMIVSTLLVVGIMWYGGQSLKPVEEISRDITFDGDPLAGALLVLAVCSALYVASIIWIYKTLKPIWK